jgi:hypothetical protein
MMRLFMLLMMIVLASVGVLILSEYGDFLL